MKLNESSLNWSIEHLYKENDTDLFPRLEELNILSYQKNDLLKILKNVDIGNHNWNASRRFIIPKSELSYRLATQLDPIDSIIFSAIIYEYGNNIETRRRPLTENIVFSYRFKPKNDGTLYDDNKWNDFWSYCAAKANEFEYIVYLDIADFYNQIYHHVIENQLISSNIPNQITKSIMSLVESVTQGVSRGIPIGPHTTHLLAEMSLIPVDDSLVTRGYQFCRYADDIIVFCKNVNEAHIIFYQIAEVLDKQQRLILQKNKTKLYSKNEFISLCNSMISNNPISEIEKTIIFTINKHSNGDPYSTINTDQLTEEEKNSFKEQSIEAIIEDYLQRPDPDFSRLRWFYRRLSQTKLPVAIDYSIRNMHKLIPAISDVCHYIVSSSENYEGDLKSIGNEIINLLNHEIIRSNEFFQISLLSLFTNNTGLNHFDKLIQIYNLSSDNIKRKIILSAKNHEAVSWISELKESYPKFDNWNKRAFIISSSILPPDEKKYFLKKHKSKLSKNELTELMLINWALKN